ncbi:MAG: hypothetical protein ABW167_04020 [Baekduia sp.]
MTSMKRRRHQHERRRRTRANRKPAPATARDDDAAPVWPGLKVALHWLDQQDGHDVLATMMLLNRLGMLNARPAGSPEVTEWMLEHLAVHLAGGELLRTGAEEQEPPPRGRLDLPVSDLSTFVKALEVWSITTMVTYQAAEATAPEDEQLSEMGVLLQTGLRWEYDPGIADREIGRIEPLFSPFDDTLIKQFGFDSRQVAILVECVSDVILRRLSEDWRATDGIAAKLRARPREVAPGAAQLFAVTSEQLFDAVASHDVSVSLDACRSYLTAMSPESDEPWPSDAIAQLDCHRIRPFLPCDAGVLIAVGGPLAFAPRRQFERAFTSTELEAKYTEHRGRWLEREAVRLLAEALRPDLALTDVTISYGDVRLDRDGLIVLDDVAIALEAKAFQLPPSGERGNLAALEKRYRAHLEKAARQARDTVDAVIAGANVSRKGVSGQQHVEVRHAIPLAVTLPDVASLTPRITRLMPPGLADNLIALSIDDLAWCTEMVRLPAELAHYLILRQWLGQQTTRVVDEDDWLRLYLKSGPDRLEAHVTGWSYPDLDVLVRADGTSRRTLPGDGLPYPLHLWPTLLALDQLRPPGWLVLSHLLLDQDQEQLLQLSTTLTQADAIARRTSEATVTTVLTDHLLAQFVSLPSAALADATPAERFNELVHDATPAAPPVRALLVRTCDNPTGWPLAQTQIEVSDRPA